MQIKDVKSKTFVMSKSQKPTLFDKARNLYAAVKRASKDGGGMADKELRDSRFNVCKKCELWMSSGNFFMGECAHKKCGCTKFKIYLKSEKCPLNKW